MVKNTQFYTPRTNTEKHTIGVGMVTYTWTVPHLATDLQSSKQAKILKHAQH